MTFKLPDFLMSSLLNELRHSMKAPLTQSFVFESKFKQIDIPISERLRKSGIDVNIDEIKIHDDGTLLYDGYRVLLYIRDITTINGQEKMPRYHLAYCQTLEKMHRDNRFGRYVVANSDSGQFHVNVMDSEIKTQAVKLNVCQNCLDTIRWMNFDLKKMSRSARLSLVSHFSLQAFFKAYPRDLISIKPLHNSDTAPLNDYPNNWSEISHKTKMLRGSKCKNCGVLLENHSSKFLHVHHRNGLKNDNSDSNLIVLCIACHAEQPKHSHMKSLPDYQEFMKKYQR